MASRRWERSSSSPPLRAPQGSGAHARVGERLGERIVHLVGEQLALVDEADAPVLAGNVAPFNALMSPQNEKRSPYPLIRTFGLPGAARRFQTALAGRFIKPPLMATLILSQW